MLVSMNTVSEQSNYIDVLYNKKELTTSELVLYIENKCPFLYQYIIARAHTIYENSIRPHKTPTGHLCSQWATNVVKSKQIGIKPIKTKGPYKNNILYWEKNILDKTEKSLMSRYVKALQNKSL